MPSKWMNVVEAVDAADLAVRTACVLELLIEERPVPPFAEDAIKGAIAMLDDALSASALLTGNAYEKKFSGNLNALCWATDSYVVMHPKHTTSTSLCADVEEELRRIRKKMGFGLESVKSQCIAGAEEAMRFFDTLAKILAQRADAMLRA